MDGGIRPGTGRLDGKALTGRLADLAQQAAEKAAAAVTAAGEMGGDCISSDLGFDDGIDDLLALPRLDDELDFVEASKRGTRSGGGGTGEV